MNEKSAQDYLTYGLERVHAAESTEDLYEAISACERALALGLPGRDEVICRALLGGNYIKTEREGNGIEQIEKALKLDREGKHGFFERKTQRTACLHRYDMVCVLHSREIKESKGTEASIAYLQQALSLYDYLSPTQGALLYLELGLLYIEKGDEELARESWMKALEAEIRNEPGYEEYKFELDTKEKARNNLEILESGGGWLPDRFKKPREKIKAEQSARKEEQRKQKEALKLKKQEEKEKLRAEKQAQKEKERAERLKLEEERLKQKVTVGLEEEGGLGIKGEEEKHVKKGGILVPFLNREIPKWKFIAMAAGILSAVAIATVIPLLTLSKQKVPVPAVQIGGVIDEKPLPPTPTSPGSVSGGSPIDTTGGVITEKPASVEESTSPTVPPSPGLVSGEPPKVIEAPPPPPAPPATTPLSPHGLYAQKNSPVVHRGDCPHISGLGENDVLKFNSAGEAIASSGKPCDSCRPYILGRPLSPLSPQGIYSLKTSGFFHRGNCPRLSGVDINDLIRFDNRTQAIRGGGRPCDLCKP